MSFSDPRWLWGLLGLPVLALLQFWALRGRSARLRELVGERPGHALLALGLLASATWGRRLP